MSKVLHFLLGSYTLLNGALSASKAGETKASEAEVKLKLDFLNSEYKYVNERLAAYSEADQKIIAVAATIIVGALGFTLSKSGSDDATRLPYIFFLSAGFLNLAVIQSVLYSSLALFALERKIRLTLRIEELLGIPVSDTSISTFAFNLTYKKSYKVAVIPYYLFKSLAGGILFSFIYNYPRPGASDILYWTAYVVSAISCVTGFGVVWFNAYEQSRLSKNLLAKYKATDASRF